MEVLFGVLDLVVGGLVIYVVSSLLLRGGGGFARGLFVLICFALLFFIITGYADGDYFSVNLGFGGTIANFIILNKFAKQPNT